MTTRRASKLFSFCNVNKTLPKGCEIVEAALVILNIFVDEKETVAF